MACASLQSRFTGCRTASTSSYSSFSAHRVAAFTSLRPAHARECRFVVKAEGQAADEDDFEKRLAGIAKKSKTPQPKQKSSSAPTIGFSDPKPAGKKQQQYDFTEEELQFETAPHRGDMATNVALGATLLWLPLSIAAVGRGLFVKYRFTNKRISVVTTAPWDNKQLDAAYQQVKDVKCVGRGIGLWGDMVVTLNNGDKIEMRALPKYKEMRDYILSRKAELSPDINPMEEPSSKAKGFA